MKKERYTVDREKQAAALKRADQTMACYRRLYRLVRDHEIKCESTTAIAFMMLAANAWCESAEDFVQLSADAWWMQHRKDSAERKVILDGSELVTAYASRVLAAIGDDPSEEQLLTALAVVVTMLKGEKIEKTRVLHVVASAYDAAEVSTIARAKA